MIIVLYCSRCYLIFPTISEQIDTHNYKITSRSVLSVRTQNRRIAEGLMKQRSTYKARVAKSVKTLNHFTKETYINLIEKHSMK